MDHPFLYTSARFGYRFISPDDAESLYHILREPDTTRYLNHLTLYSVEEASALIERYLEGWANRQKYPFAIIDKTDGSFVGVYLYKLDIYDPDSFEFTVFLAPKYQHCGVFYESLQALLPFWAHEIPETNLRGFVMIDNVPSWKVLEKGGFTLEKIFSVDGIPLDIKGYLLTKEAYRKGNPMPPV